MCKEWEKQNSLHHIHFFKLMYSLQRRFILYKNTPTQNFEVCFNAAFASWTIHYAVLRFFLIILRVLNVFILLSSLPVYTFRMHKFLSKCTFQSDFVFCINLYQICTVRFWWHLCTFYGTAFQHSRNRN